MSEEPLIPKHGGYRTTNNRIAMIYFLAGKFDFALPALTHSK